MAAPVVALVLVSHSRGLAEGVAELAAQMAPDVVLVPAGGTDDGRLGTGFEVVEQALDRATDAGRSAVILTDLGSAVLTAESVLEFADDDVVARVRIADAPFVEGAVAAAVAAQGGAGLTEVVRAAQDAARAFGGGDGDGAPGAAGGRDVTTGGEREQHDSSASALLDGQIAVGPEAPTVRGTVILRNKLGLHARPAAQLARVASGFQSSIEINGVDARSVLAVIGLGAVGGMEVAVTATGPDAGSAVRAVVAELEEGFGEA